MQLNKVLILVLFIVLGYNSFGQNSNNKFSDDIGLNTSAIMYLDSLDELLKIDSNKLFLSVSEQGSLFAKKNHLNFLEVMIRVKEVNFHRKLGNLDKALELSYDILKTGEKQNDDKIIIKGKLEIAHTYAAIEDNAKSLRFFKEVEREYINNEELSEVDYAHLKNNLGTMYRNLPNGVIEDFDTAKLYLEAALNSFETSKLEGEVAGCMVNLGGLYVLRSTVLEKEENLKTANEYYFNALEIYQSIGDDKFVGQVLFSIGRVFYGLENYSLAMKYFKEGMVHQLIADDLYTLLSTYDYIRYLHELDGNLDSAYYYRENWVSVAEKINEFEVAKNAEKLDIIYQTEKKEKENELLRKDGELKNIEIIAQKKQRALLFGGLGVTFILLIIIFNRFKISQKQKKEIEEKKKEVELQKELVEEKNTEITDSINYAQKIQQALLKAEDHVSEKFPPHFILFKPKDIVSGDFYWALEKKEYLYMTVADCTGHGVPGAFMSMLGISFLNEINSRERSLTPAEILDELRERIIKELSQTGAMEDSKDGMDMSLIRINQQTNEIDWAGANNSLYILREEGIEEIRADRQPVAYSDYAKPFTNNKVRVEQGNILYLFSDGFIDQFGGEKGKKYKSKQFKFFLNSIRENPMEVQKTKLNDEFEAWKGDIEQIDDVCVIGVRV